MWKEEYTYPAIDLSVHREGYGAYVIFGRELNSLRPFTKVPVSSLPAVKMNVFGF